MNRTRRSLTTRLGAGVMIALSGAALLAAACGGTSNSDKTATANAGGRTPLATARAAATTVSGTVTTAGTTVSGTVTTAATSAATPGATTSASVGVTVVKVATNATLGQLFTDGSGMTVYIFKNDVANSGKSAAEGLTAVWPPLTADAPPAAPAGATGTFAVITRVDGKKQVTYNGLPLYYFVNDKAAGDTNGQGVGGVWFVATP